MYIRSGLLSLIALCMSTCVANEFLVEKVTNKVNGDIKVRLSVQGVIGINKSGKNSIHIVNDEHRHTTEWFIIKPSESINFQLITYQPTSNNTSLQGMHFVYLASFLHVRMATKSERKDTPNKKIELRTFSALETNAYEVRFKGTPKQLKLYKTSGHSVLPDVKNSN